jgi:pimeloyl-ACP methyl ester carboxylesterase
LARALGWRQGERAGKDKDKGRSMTPILLVPGLACTARLYAPQLPALWQLGPVTVANHTTSNSMVGIGKAILDQAPPRFHLIGLSMGGYIAFDLLRQQPERIAKVALLDTGSRADLPEQSERRRKFIAMAREGQLNQVNEALWPMLVHESRAGDHDLRAIVDAMMQETGAEAFIRQQEALIGRPDSRPGFGAIANATLVIVGDGDRLTPPELSAEIVSGIKGARLETVARCGHLSTLEQPETVTKLLYDWLSD